MSKIILHSYYCDLDAYRNDDFELAIELPCNANVALAKKASELSDLESITSDFSVSFDILMTSKDLAIFNRIEYLQANNGKLVYRATLESEGLQLIDGQLYLDKTSERVHDGIVSYTVQLIGTHQTWKESLRNMLFSDLDLGSVIWRATDIVNLMTADRYQDGGQAIYPLIANFGEWFGIRDGLDEITLYDVRFLVYKLAILQQAFCKAGYRIRSNFLNSDYFRGQADYLMRLNFGTDSDIDQGIEVIAESDADQTNVSALNVPMQFNTVIKDNEGLFNLGFWRYENSTGKSIDNFFVDLSFEFCNPDPTDPAFFSISVLITDGLGNTVLVYVVPEMDVSGVPGLPVGQCITINATVDISAILRDNLINTGLLEPTWRVFILNNGFGVGTPRAEIKQGARVRYYSLSPNHFNQGDIFQVSKVLNPNISVYQWLLDNKLMYNLRFKTSQAEKIVDIEPSPAQYRTHDTYFVPSVTANGFLKNIDEPENVIDITKYIETCQFIEKPLPKSGTKNFVFSFVDSTDNYAKYKNFGGQNSLFSNGLQVGALENKQEIKLALYQPTLNDFETYSSVFKSRRLYIPYMWENEAQNGQAPEQGTNLGIRTFCVFGTATQIVLDNAVLSSVAYVFEGVTYFDFPCVGQVFENRIGKAPNPIKLATENNVFFDNYSQAPTGKNIINTFYQFDVNQALEAVEFELRIWSNNLFFFEMDIRKIVRIFSEQSDLARFNGNYLWLSCIKNIDSGQITLILKPILPCDYGR